MHDVSFLLPGLSELELKAIAESSLELNFPYWLGGEVAWAGKFYLILRQYRPGVTLSRCPSPTVLNIGHVHSWRKYTGTKKEYRVSARADYRKLWNVDFEILQNPHAVTKKNQGYVHHWLPRVIPRDETRKSVEVIAYAGRLGKENLCENSIRESCRKLGIDIKLIDKTRWHDMRHVDVLIGIRSFSRKRYLHKPPSKLINAWLAEIPFIGGYDSAYAALGRPGVDYIRVTTESELSHELTKLRDNPEYYEGFVLKGKERATEFTNANVAEQWIQLLDNAISSDFDQYRNNPFSRSIKRAFRAPIDNVLDTLSQLKKRFSVASRH